MKRKNVETVQRVMGILDALAFIIPAPTNEALACASEMLECVLKNEAESK